MLTSSINSGYFNRASSHNIFGYDITLNISYAMLPSNSQSYDFNIPDDSITYNFQFKYPKKYLVESHHLFNLIFSTLTVFGIYQITKKLFNYSVWMN